MLNGIAVHAFGPYASGSGGYDVSYPQCPGTSAPAGAFGIIGANDGRPFTVNPCFGNEYRGAANSVYINAAYAKAYRGNITIDCSTGPSTAWDIGCSEAETSINAVAGHNVSMWWLDVETANSWSSNRSLNQAAVQGAISRLGSAGPVGVYSTAYAWGRIAGSDFVPTGVSGVWVPAPQCSGASSFITGATVWLTQRIVNNVDVDTAC
ncbi:MAG TPA: hypothetical protein VNA65_11545 [Candidatus Dormibacteraeota bacterium]|nr:hypothetical protein [Candidatus Dormibacteraeota bacterium]